MAIPQEETKANPVLAVFLIVAAFCMFAFSVYYAIAFYKQEEDLDCIKIIQSWIMDRMRRGQRRSVSE